MLTQAIAVIEKHGLPYKSGLTPVAEYMRMSMDYQKYSVEFQCGAIRQYAVRYNMAVVRTYLDHGRSTLTYLSGPCNSPIFNERRDV